LSIFKILSEKELELILKEHELQCILFISIHGEFFKSPTENDQYILSEKLDL